MDQVKLVVYVPKGHAAKVRKVIGAAEGVLVDEGVMSTFVSEGVGVNVGVCIFSWFTSSVSARTAD